MKHHTKHGQHMKAKHLLSRTGYKSGGDVASDKAMISKAIHEHDAQLHEGKKTHLKLKTGGAVEGKASGGRLDKLARGGAHHGKKSKSHVTVNVLNHPGSGMPPPPRPMPPPVPALPPGGPMPGGPGAGPMAGPGGPPMGPGGMKTGGHVKKRALGGMMGAPTQGYSKGPLPSAPMIEPHLARGGRLGGKPAPHMTAGAGSGPGREEKADIEERKAKPKAK